MTGGSWCQPVLGPAAMTGLVFGLLHVASVGNALAASTVTCYYCDPQSTVVATADAAGTAVATNDYRPYGSPSLGASANGPSYHGSFPMPMMRPRLHDGAVLRPRHRPLPER